MSQARMVSGSVVRDEGDKTQFSIQRFMLVLFAVSVLVITNPANELRDTVKDIVDNVTERMGGESIFGQRNRSEWQLRKLLDPPISVTNYLFLTVEERHTKVEFLLLTTSWSCPYFDETVGSFCSALERNLCHEKPLLHDPKDYAYTAHRVICYILILSSLLTFCYGGRYPVSWTTDPLLGALLRTFGRAHFSLFFLALDLFNAAINVYPALAQIGMVVPTLKDGRIASGLGLPDTADFIFYVIVLVVFIGGGSNALASALGRHTCFGFDSTVGAAAGYCTAFSLRPGQFTPQTVLWGYLPVNAVLGGSSLAWILAGMMGAALGQFHLDNVNLVKAISQTILSAFKVF